MRQPDPAEEINEQRRRFLGAVGAGISIAQFGVVGAAKETPNNAGTGDRLAVEAIISGSARLVRVSLG
jgi:hypothetical protein